MRTDTNYEKKIEILRDFFRSGWVYQSLDQMRLLLGYANRSGVKLFFERLCIQGVLELDGKNYIPARSLIEYPLFESVRAGLPFTPETQSVSTMDLESYLIEHPASTYFVRVKGDSMEGAGIIEWDIVILDRSRTPQNDDIVIASLDGDVTLKYFQKKNGVLSLIPANSKYTPIVVTSSCEILGVITGSVRKYH